MSFFTSYNCQIVGDFIVSHISWSQSSQIIALAVFCVDENDREINQVLFCNSEGEVISNTPILHDFEACSFAWHPTENVLAIGWGDGMISSWSVDLRCRPVSLSSNNNQHLASVAVLKWNFVGKRLVSGDKKGIVCIWSVDSRGMISPIRQYKKKGEITSIIYCPMAMRFSEGLKRTDGKQNGSHSPSFFFGTDRGAIVFADDFGHCTDVQQLSSSVDTMMFFEEKSRLIVITRSLLLTQYQVTDDGRVSKVMQVKLSVSGDTVEKGIKSVVWAGPGLIAAATEEKVVRLLDIAADESYNISLTSILGDQVSRSDRVVSVSFSPVDRYLAVGTVFGLVIVWKFVGAVRDISGSRVNLHSTSASDWRLIFKTSLASPVIQLSWYGGRGILAASTEDGSVLLTESVMHSSMCGDLFVMQTSSSEVGVIGANSALPNSINTGIQIRGLAVGKTCFVVWNGKIAKIYKADANLQFVAAVGAVQMPGSYMAIADSSFIVDEAWFVVESNCVKINNFSGTQKGIITCSEGEGQPEYIDINNRYLAVFTSKGTIKVFDVHTPTKPKQLGSAGQFFVDSNLHLRIRSVKVNCSGTKVIILTDKVEGTLAICNPNSSLYMFDRNRGTITSFNFEVYLKTPRFVFWDDVDDRLFACEARAESRPLETETRNNLSSVSFQSKNSALDSLEDNNALNSDDEDIEVFLFFGTSENGILMQDSFPRKSPYGALMGLSVPRLYFRSAVEESDIGSVGAKQCKLYSKVMRDFLGVEDISETIKSALLNFSFHLTLGKLDEAYKSVKAINSPSIWENMAQMCVKTKRLDVAEVCLGNMGHARGSAALRESRKNGNLEVSVGVLAIQLGLLDDAAKLFRDANRYDMLNKLYQAAGLWDKAIQTASLHDRIHLKSTHYHFAKHLESIGRIEESIEHFQLSDNGRSEIPRMLFQLGRVDELGEFVLKSDDSILLKWWAAYLESIGRYDKAKKFYNKAKDYLSLVRISCFKGDFNKAAEIVSESGDRASSYHFARQLEHQGEYQEAINFYAGSGCYNHSIRLARTYNLDSELMKFALKSTPSLMIECGMHFEEKGEFDKAVQLYHKGGDVPRALDLCFRASQADSISSQSTILFDMLNTIAEDLGDDSSPQTLARCAEFLVQHKRFEKAIELYVKAKRYRSAVEMCVQQRVSITDDMVENLTPPDSFDKTERKEILLDLAKALKKQGSYLTAYKKYTQAGDRLHAIKCLIRSGNTKAVIEFASISRSPEIYKVAANYLQQMNWRESVEIMKAVIMFYTKAKAFLQLAGFYDSCAQVEIDEYRDYEKASGALKESMKYLKRDESIESVTMSQTTENRILLIERFIQAKKHFKSDPTAMLRLCQGLLEEPFLEEAVRAGDCLALMIEYYHANNLMADAAKFMSEMHNRNILPNPYLDTSIIEDISRYVNNRNNKNISNNTGMIGHSEALSDYGQNKPERERKISSDEDDINEELETVEEKNNKKALSSGRYDGRNFMKK